MPHLQELVERHQDDPFVILAVNFRDSEQEFRQGMESFNVTWPTIYQGSEGGQPANPIGKLFQVRGFPTYFLIGPDGKILGSGHDGAAYDKKIAELVKEIKESARQ